MSLKTLKLGKLDILDLFVISSFIPFIYTLLNVCFDSMWSCLCTLKVNLNKINGLCFSPYLPSDIVVSSLSKAKLIDTIYAIIPQYIWGARSIYFILVVGGSSGHVLQWHPLYTFGFIYRIMS